MLYVLSLFSAHALTCDAGGADPVCDAANDMIDAANAAYPGSSPIFDGARGNKDEQRVLARLRNTLDDLVQGGCLTEPSYDEWLAGSYGASTSGSSSSGPLSSVTFSTTPKAFTAVGANGTFGDEFGTYNKQTQLVGDYSDGSYTYGFWLRVRGSRGVWMAFAGTCDGPENAGVALANHYAGDVSALDVGGSDGVCTADREDVDCDGICDPADLAGGNDCDLSCDFEDSAESVDCDGQCGSTDSSASADCDGVCDVTDDLLSVDCDVPNPCIFDPLAPGCVDSCDIDPFGPGCFDICDVDPFAPGCCDIDPFAPGCFDICDFIPDDPTCS